MSRIFSYLGDREIAYRSLMRDQAGLEIQGRKLSPSKLVVLEQTHSDLVHYCTQADSGAGFKDHLQISIADAAITKIPGQYLLIRTADCYPVLFYDEEAGVVAAAHSGREGTRMNIVGKVISAMTQHYSCDPERIVAHVGAGICEDHYEVSPRLYDAFNASLAEAGFSSCTKQQRHLNLRTTIFQQLIRAGLRFFNIENVQICTYEDPGYFSYRRDKGNNRQINLIGITDE